MNIFRRLGSELSLNLRARLLEKTCLEQFGPRSENAGSFDLAETSDPGALDLLLGLGGLATARNAKSTAFCGLIAAPEQMLGKNVLICLAPLAEELNMLLARHPALGDASGGWCRGVLQAFERCIFLNPSDLRASIGFSPWCDLRLAPHFPIRLDMPVAPSATPPVYVFAHTQEAARQATGLCETLAPHTRVSVVSHDIGPPQDTIQPGGVHIHYGYDHRYPVAVLSPFDSIINGNYCHIIDPPDPLDDGLYRALSVRSYAETHTTTDSLVRAVVATIVRIQNISRAGLRFNPEIARYDTMNHQLFDECFAQFDQELKS